MPSELQDEDVGLINEFSDADVGIGEPDKAALKAGIDFTAGFPSALTHVLQSGAEGSEMGREQLATERQTVPTQPTKFIPDTGGVLPPRELSPYIPSPQDTTDYAGESIFGISPESIPSGANTGFPQITIPLSAIGKTVAGAGQYITSPRGMGMAAAAATPASPAVYAKWAYDMIKGGVESASDAVGAVKNLIGDQINRQMAPQTGEKPQPIDEEQVQRLADDAVNTAVGLVGGTLAGAHGVGMVKTVADRIRTPKTEPSPAPPSVAAESSPTAITPSPSTEAQALDFKRYQEVQQEMKRAFRAGDNDSLAKAFAENEEIKNRYKGMPPTEPKPPQETPKPSTEAANAPKGIAASVRNKWTSATEEPFGGEAGFINLDPIRELVDKATPYVRNAFNAVREIGSESQNIGKMTDLRRSVLNWSGKLQRSFGEAADAQKEISKRVPDQIRRDGLTNWIQAGGDPAILQQRLAATQAWRDPVTGKPHPQAKRLIAGYEAALNLTPEEQAVAQDVSNAYAGLGARGQHYDVLKSFKPNYVTQIWDLGRGPQGAGSSRTLRDKFKFSRASTFDTFFDGEQAGYVPKTKDISKLLPVYLHEMNSVIAARQLVEQMSKGTASDGRPLVAPRGTGVPVTNPSGGGATLIMPKAIKEGTEDYKVLPNQPALNDWRWASKDTAGNPVFLKSDLALHPEAYKRLNAILGRSAIREWYTTRTSAMAEIPKKIVQGIDMANSATKRTMFGLLAPFHQFQEGQHATGHRVNPTFNIPKVDLVGNHEQMDAVRHGLMMLPDRASENQFMEGLRPSGLVSRIPGIGPVSDWYANYLFKEYIPGLKFKTYQAILDRNMKVYAKDLASGGVAPEDVKVLSSEQANAAFGHLNYADLGRNPTIQHLLQLGLLAPDFLEARARFTGQALKGVTGAKVGREQLVALGALALGQAALAYTSAKIVGGTWDPKKPFEMVKGNRRYTLRSVPEDANSFLMDTRMFVHSRLSPIIGKGGLQYIEGRDYAGNKVTAGETTKELFEQPIPISARGFLGIGNSKLAGWEQLLGAVGLKISSYNPDELKIQQAVKLNDYADKLSRDARKLPRNERRTFINEQLKKDDVGWRERDKVIGKVQEKGVFKYE